MGLKGAPSYFQHVMQSEVLHGLQYNICEIYIDDIIIFADTADELSGNLRKVLERLAKHNITVSPEKCSFGLHEIEFVGHTLDGKGLHFTRAKLDKVLQIALPVTSKQLKSFLGVTIFFSDHIQGYTDLAKPLHQMLHAYDARKKLVWTTAQETAFYDVRDAVNNCPKVFFVDLEKPVYVATDASDYGIGAICYQIIDSKVVPINFMSKSLSAQECNWTTTEKECFAIVHALRKFEYLVRDIHFTLLTDHKNLIYIDSETSQKVKRWKLAIQQYDFDIQHIPGRLNQIADGFSRILGVPEETIFWMNEPLADDMRASHGMAFCFASAPPDCPRETILWMQEYEIPKEWESLIAMHHNDMVGHHGVERTMESILRPRADGSRQPAWDHMRTHVKRYIQRCPCCQKMSYLKVPIHTRRYTLAASQPFQRINIDRIGPLPASGSGNNCILVIVDCFYRWVSLYPLPDGKMESARRALLTHIGQFGAPLEVIHDGGTEFSNSGIAELLAMCGIQNAKTLAYSKEENGMVERANKEVMRHLRNILFETNVTKDWEDHLGTIMKIMNHQKRGKFFPSPASILFGDVSRTDEPMFIPTEAMMIDGAQLQLSAWADNMITQQKTILDLAQRIQHEKDMAHLAEQNPFVTEFALGSYVLANYHSTEGVVRHKGPPNKFLSYLRGPFKVVDRERDTYTIRSLVTKKDERIHVKELRQFIHNDDEQELYRVALRDHHDHFEIAKILSHRGDPKYRTDMEFLVRWRGYAESENLWLPYSELRDSAALHEYLLAQPTRIMQKLVPTKFFVNGAYAPENE